jgi:hypothetical protein
MIRLLIGALILLSPALCAAQTLRVQVTDPSGSQVPNASIALSKAGTPTQPAKTDIQGQYVFRNLEPGLYVVGVTAKGFAKYETPRVEVTAGRAQTLAVPLVLATASDQVTVSDTVKVEVDPSSNAGAIILRKTELEALSNDPMTSQPICRRLPDRRPAQMEGRSLSTDSSLEAIYPRGAH